MPSENSNPATSGEAVTGKKAESIIRKKLGKDALNIVLTELSESDRQGIVAEAIEQRIQLDNASKSKGARILSGLTKPFTAAGYRAKAIEKIQETGDAMSAYKALGLEGESSFVSKDSHESTVRRARLALEDAGFRDYANPKKSNHIDSVSQNESIALSQGESIKRVEGAEADVKAALLTCYDKLKEAGSDDGSQAEAIKDFQEEMYKLQRQGLLSQDPSQKGNAILENKIVRYLIGDHSKRSSSNLEQLFVAADSLKALAGEKIAKEDLSRYLDKHLTLYSASMNEGLHTKREVDNVMAAIAAGGALGGVAYMALNRAGRMEARAGVNSLLASVASAPVKGAITGAIMGGVAGVISGRGRAKAELSKAAIKSATSAEAIRTSKESNEQPSEESESEEETPSKKSNKYTKLIEDINKNNPRKSAKILYDTLAKRIEDYKKAPSDQKEIQKARVASIMDEIVARNIVSSENGIDLITYSKGNIANERKLLATQMIDAKNLIGGYDPNRNSGKDLQLILGELNTRANNEKRALRKEIAKQGAISAVKGALTGGAIGGVVSATRAVLQGGNLRDTIDNLRESYSDFRTKVETAASKIRELDSPFGSYSRAEAVVDDSNGTIVFEGTPTVAPETIPTVPGVLSPAPETIPLTPDTTASLSNAPEILLTPDKDGGYTFVVNGREMIGAGDDPGIEYNPDGSMTPESLELLRGLGFDPEVRVSSEVVPDATKEISVSEFFSLENKEAHNLIEIAGRHWHVGPRGQALYNLESQYDVNGNIVVQATTIPGVEADYSGMQLIFNPGGSMQRIGVALDVQPDGTVTIPPDSPVADLFRGSQYTNGYAELARVEDDGRIEVFSTLGNGRAINSTITVPNPEATMTRYDYSLNIRGESYALPTPESVTAPTLMEASTGIESVKGLYTPITYEATGAVSELQTSTGELVQVDHKYHYGGYSDVYDSYFSATKDGPLNSGISVVRAMVGEEGEGLSTQQIDQLFLDKVANGEIAEGDVVESYLELLGNSPEALVTTRAMLGGFEMDVDGDGVMDLIDTTEEINIAADILSRDPEGYDDFVNDTLDLFYDKIKGGTIRFIDYSQEHYQYTSWATLGEDNNVIQHLTGVMGSPSATNGVGILFLDRNGNPIYDEQTVRNIWRLPDEYGIEYVSDRLNCMQKTARGIFAQANYEPTPTSTPAPMPAPIPTPTPTPEPLVIAPDIPKDAENLERIDQQILQDIGEDISSKNVVVEPTTQVKPEDITPAPSPENYSGTSANIVENQASASATNASDYVSQFNNYAEDIGGINSGSAGAFPVQADDQAQAAADAAAAATQAAIAATQATQPITDAATNDGAGWNLEDILAEFGIY